MKICPICQSRAFDDAEICYGCLHRFEEGDGVHTNEVHTDEVHTNAAVTKEAPSEQCIFPTNQDAVLTTFSIRFTPETNESGLMIWKCAVETS